MISLHGSASKKSFDEIRLYAAAGENASPKWVVSQVYKRLTRAIGQAFETAMISNLTANQTR